MEVILEVKVSGISGLVPTIRFDTDTRDINSQFYVVSMNFSSPPRKQPINRINPAALLRLE